MIWANRWRNYLTGAEFWTYSRYKPSRLQLRKLSTRILYTVKITPKDNT